MTDFNYLRKTLRRIDGRGYKAYKDISGTYHEEDLTLFVDHVQGDPFAAPSKIRIRISGNLAKLPSELFNNRIRLLAFEDFLARSVDDAISRLADGHRGSGKSGLVTIDSGAQEVLKRTAIVLTREWVEARFQIGLPAGGRRVLGRQAEEMLCEELPEIAERGLCWDSLPQKKATAFVECVENFTSIQDSLGQKGLIAFVADNSILPRQSGASNKPLKSNVVPFSSPDSLKVEFELPNRLPNGETRISGMGVPKGVTLIVGGGYHGKSTLLDALENGVYPHIPSDGREYVVTDPDSVKIRAEDGRAVQQVDISPFISNIPHGRSTKEFSTDDASGSTSQAANIIEAIEVGAKALLLDEDTSATNFMIRDARMQTLVNKENEPITPLIDRIRQLYEKNSVSTVLVMGGSGDYFDVADTVIMMKEYLPKNVSKEAKQIASDMKCERKAESPLGSWNSTNRIILGRSLNPSKGRRDVKIDAKSRDLLFFGTTAIDLGGIEQIVDISQTKAIGAAIYLLKRQLGSNLKQDSTLSEMLDWLENHLEVDGLDQLDPFYRPEKHPGNYALPRRYEIAAALNRYRDLKVKQTTKIY